jgi:hypothetical protein
MPDLQDCPQFLIHLQDAYTGFQNRQEQVNQVVYLEDPDKTDFGSSTEDVILGDLSYQTVLIEILVYGQFHEIVVQGDQYLV